MFRKLKIAISAVVLLLAAYSITTGNLDITPFTSLALALLLLVMGFEERHKKKKWISYLCFFAFAVNFYVFVQSFLI
ncbi:hypothetical protein JYA63_10895 [Fictibacillus nanhaiensis]|uniref:DUF3953 domain-containing protein n=1 Tax=Fictibacillus nanhaiensis TaxID=742169 RepID=A0ABS2ZRV6_9BACL|nr:hypothetical protein [Fictibacillus nanhaiensis]